MAERMVTLTLTPREEKALAGLVAWACNNYHSKGVEGDDGYDHLRIMMDAQGRDELGRVNGALNAIR